MVSASPSSSIRHGTWTVQTEGLDTHLVTIEIPLGVWSIHLLPADTGYTGVWRAGHAAACCTNQDGRRRQVGLLVLSRPLPTK